LLEKGNETVMSHMQRLVTMSDKKELACLNSQEKTGEYTFGAATMMENQNSIMIEEEDAKFKL